MKFLQVVGITLDELRAKKLWRGAPFLEILESHVPALVTDLARGSILELPGVAEHIRERTRAEGSATGLLYVKAVRWKESGGWLRKKELTVTLGALAARDLGSYLAGRIPFDQPLMISGGGRPGGGDGRAAPRGDLPPRRCARAGLRDREELHPGPGRQCRRDHRLSCAGCLSG